MLEDIFRNNRRWSAAQTAADPEYFRSLANLQAPEFFWIGCSDSRVPANQVAGLKPGEVFVHRNVANVVHSSDMNLLSALEFAIEALGVQHVIVCGHYGCGGIRAAFHDERNGIVDHWLAPVRATYRRHRRTIDGQASEAQKLDALCEANIRDRVRDVATTTIVRDAWHRGQELAIHGWVYGLADGLLRDLGVSVQRPDDVAD